jgi:hypothetical protein
MPTSRSFLQIEYYSTLHVVVQCTEISELEKIKDFILRKHPTAEVRFPNTMDYELLITGLKNTEKAVCWEILSFLCDRGWTPIAGDQKNSTYYLYHLK